MVQGSRVNRVAARIGKAEFFEPLILIEPARAFPPCSRILSIPGEQKTRYTCIIVFRLNVAVILLPQKFGQAVGLSNPSFERDQPAGARLSRCRFEQLANEFIAETGGK